MPSYNLVAFAVDCVLAIAVSLVVYRLVRESLRQVLQSVVGLPEATTFYLRVLLLVVVFAALGQVLSGVQLKSDAHFLDYVWAVGSDLSNVFQGLFVDLLVYVALITLLVVVLRPKNGK